MTVTLTSSESLKAGPIAIWVAIWVDGIALPMPRQALCPRHGFSSLQRFYTESKVLPVGRPWHIGVACWVVGRDHPSRVRA
jgi:hypothetical protein